MVRSGGYIEVKPQYFEQIPIPELPNGKEFENKAEKVISLTAELQNLALAFTDLLQSKFDIEKLSKKLQQWHSLDFKEFSKELKKVKIFLDLSEEANWMQYFNEKKNKTQNLQSQINTLEQQIDAMVYGLYGLTEEEIKVVENS